MKLHHIGVAVPCIEKALDAYRLLFPDAAPGAKFEDPIQEIRGVFVPAAPGVLFELLEPSGPGSHLERLIARKAGAYHVAYEVRDLADSLSGFESKGWMATSAPQPAVAFEGRPIVFLFSPDGLLVELIEAQKLKRSSE